MGAFVDNVLLHAAEAIKDHSASAAFDVVESRAAYTVGESGGDRPLVHLLENLSHCRRFVSGGSFLESTDVRWRIMMVLPSEMDYTKLHQVGFSALALADSSVLGRSASLCKKSHLFSHPRRIPHYKAQEAAVTLL